MTTLEDFQVDLDIEVINSAYYHKGFVFQDRFTKYIDDDVTHADEIPSEAIDEVEN